jgi:asparagine N-glycosylation enzyme membrane subunit Stt3
MRPRDTLASTLIVVAALAAIVGVGVHLRSIQPLSSPALAAEDPYTHVVFTKEALERGWFGDSWYLGTTMYPPGLHALAGTLAPHSGVTLYEFARIAPLVFAGVAIVGTYVLGARLGGAAGGLAAALVTAVMPEHIFRTELFFPTALDLAIVPAFLLLLWMAGTSERGIGAALAFAALSVALAFTHPWLVPLFAAPALAALALWTLRESEGAHGYARRLALPAALATGASAFAMASRWTDSDTGFADLFAKLPVLSLLARIDLPPPVLFLALFVVIGAATAAGVALMALLAAAKPRVPQVARIALAAVVALVLLGLVLKLSAGKLPPDVSYAHMIGTVPIALALVGVGIALLFPTPLGDLGLVTGATLFPLTALNLFQSTFWPSRTVAYLCVAVALLAGASVAWAVRQSLAYVTNMKLRRIAAPTALLASICLLSGAVVAHPASEYKWYYLYNDDEFAGLQRVADAISADPNAKVITSTWQPALMMKTLAPPAQDRYSEKFWSDGGERAKVLAEAQGAPRYVIVDKYTRQQVAKQGGDLGILDDGSWKLVYRTASGSLSLYEWVGSG